MERTIIICNTSSMPVAAREASVYTAVTLAEYYRQMGLNVLLLADSTIRWAQAMREMSGRLEEIPGEEAFPAYLESVIASFYERAGIVRLRDDGTGSVTIGGTVSPAGGNFEEPVTQATLKVVGAFHGLSRERSDARKYPAIHPLDSWSKYPGIIDAGRHRYAHDFLSRGTEVEPDDEGRRRGRHVASTTTSSTSRASSSTRSTSSRTPSTRSTPPCRPSASGMSSACSSRSWSPASTSTARKTARAFFNQLRQKFLDWNGCRMAGRRIHAGWRARSRPFVDGGRAGTDEKGAPILDTLGKRQ